jgi:hypothetical protein
MDTEISKEIYNFSYEEKKSLAVKIEKLTKKEDFVNLFKIINREISNNFTVNKNGLFLDISSLSNETLTKINKYLSDKIEEAPKIQYTFSSYSSDEFHDINSLGGPKLSNKEKSIIKRLRISENDEMVS